jgi:hypothetical protein
MSQANSLFESGKPASAAVISPCGIFRNSLTRTWDEVLPVLPVVMVNPSKADHHVNDPTVLRLIAFARRWGYGGILIENLNEYRSSHPSELELAADPVGPETDRHLRALVDRGGDILVAWGNNGTFKDRDKSFLKMAREAGARLICLGTTGGGHPKHPLARGKHRVPEDFEPVPFCSEASA